MTWVYWLCYTVIAKKEIFEIIGRTCPELYEVYEQCPDIVDAMQPNILGFDFVSEINGRSIQIQISKNDNQCFKQI